MKIGRTHWRARREGLALYLTALLAVVNSDFLHIGIQPIRNLPT